VHDLRTFCDHDSGLPGLPERRDKLKGLPDFLWWEKASKTHVVANMPPWLLAKVTTGRSFSTSISIFFVNAVFPGTGGASVQNVLREAVVLGLAPEMHEVFCLTRTERKQLFKWLEGALAWMLLILQRALDKELFSEDANFLKCIGGGVAVVGSPEWVTAASERLSMLFPKGPIPSSVPLERCDSDGTDVHDNVCPASTKLQVSFEKPASADDCGGD
jgi:hypothetical protein